MCAAQVEVRPHSAKLSRGRVSHRQISPIKSGPQPIVTAQGRIRGRMPIVLPLPAIGRSHLGNPGSSDKHQLIGNIGLTYDTDRGSSMTNINWFAGVDAKNEGRVFRGPNPGEFRPGTAGLAPPHPQRFWLTGFGSRYNLELAVEHEDQFRWQC